MVKKRVTEIKILQDPRNPTVREIIDAFEGAFNESDDRPPTYAMFYTDRREDEGKVLLQVMALEYESGATGMFLIRGQLWEGAKRAGKLQGFYNANTKAGHLQLAD